MKEDVEKSLPPKEEIIIEVALTTIQKQFYRAVYERNTTFLFKGLRAKCCSVLFCAVLCCAMQCCALMYCSVVLCYAVLCYAVLCYASLCFDVLCYAVMFYTMLCCTVLCYAIDCSAYLSYLSHYDRHIFEAPSSFLNIASYAFCIYGEPHGSDVKNVFLCEFVRIKW